MFKQGYGELNVFCDNSNLFIPNTFSPNSDGHNDVFYPRGKGVFTIRSFRVFNRWGDLVFERTNFQPNDITAGWNGMHKGRMASPDVYIYTLEVVCTNNTIFNEKRKCEPYAVIVLLLIRTLFKISPATFL